MCNEWPPEVVCPYVGQGQGIVRWSTITAVYEFKGQFQINGSVESSNVERMSPYVRSTASEGFERVSIHWTGGFELRIGEWVYVQMILPVMLKSAWRIMHETKSAVRRRRVRSNW